MVTDLRALPESPRLPALGGGVHLLPDERTMADVAGYVEKLHAERYPANREGRYRRSRGRSAVDWLEHYGCVLGVAASHYGIPTGEVLAAADEELRGLSHGRHVEALRETSPALVRLIDVLREVFPLEPHAA
ncbi:MAG TPA: hypothetical protein VFN57_10670 [Thermomicrobiaceae bacterium]|nr:hypothetical protein [Thermomicrobiaceae bacterium]